ncbi:MAG: hypothetical protein WA197_23320 [Candidatus Acidiferrales bacterium]
MPRSQESTFSSGQLRLDLAPARRCAARDNAAVPEAAVPLARYLTRAEAARYLRCSLRFLDGMGLPFIRKGRCKLYDRIDLDERMQHDKRRGRAWKEILWPVNVDSTAARTRGSGGSASFSRMDAAYAKALGVSNAPTLKASSSA